MFLNRLLLLSRFEPLMQHSSAAIAVLCSVVSSSTPGDFISEAGGVAGYLLMHIDKRISVSNLSATLACRCYERAGVLHA